MEKKITVDKAKCIHCGQCIKDCLMSCIEFDNDKIPQYAQGGADRCLKCQHCMAICPAGALSFGDRNPNNSSEVNYGNSKDLLNLIKSRRSLRQYKKENVQTEIFDKIKEMLPYSPTGGNVNCLHFSFVETKEKMDKIIKISYEELAKRKDNTPLTQMCIEGYKNGQDIIYRGATAMVAVSIDKSKAIAGCETTDPIIALSYVDLYAQSLGLGTLWCDMALDTALKIPEVYSILEIPDGYTLSYILMLGLPAVKYHRTIQPEPYKISTIR